MKKLGIAIIALLILTGCGASTIRLSPEDRNATKTLSIDVSDVTFPKQELTLQIMGGMGSAFGLIGGLIEANQNKSPQQILHDNLLENDLLKKTVTQAFKYHISKSSFFEVMEKDRADAHMIIEVVLIQFAKDTFSDSTALTMKINATIKNKGNQTVWQDSSYIWINNSNLIKHQFSEFLVDKNKLKEGISIVSQVIIQEFIKESGGQPVPIKNNLYKTNAIAQ